MSDNLHEGRSNRYVGQMRYEKTQDLSPRPTPMTARQLSRKVERLAVLLGRVEDIEAEVLTIKASLLEEQNIGGRLQERPPEV
jgi:hypothetical protein